MAKKPFFEAAQHHFEPPPPADTDMIINKLMPAAEPEPINPQVALKQAVEEAARQVQAARDALAAAQQIHQAAIDAYEGHHYNESERLLEEVRRHTQEATAQHAKGLFR